MLLTDVRRREDMKIRLRNYLALGRTGPEPTPPHPTFWPESPPRTARTSSPIRGPAPPATHFPSASMTRYYSEGDDDDLQSGAPSSPWTRPQSATPRRTTGPAHDGAAGARSISLASQQSMDASINLTTAPPSSLYAEPLYSCHPCSRTLVSRPRRARPHLHLPRARRARRS